MYLESKRGIGPVIIKKILREEDRGKTNKKKTP